MTFTSRQVPFVLYWLVENVQFCINSISWNFESIFLKILHPKGLFDAIKESLNFPTCRRILHIYRQWLLICDFT